MSEPARALPPGYTFVEVLGSGGFGEVVLARHEAMNRLVAVKQVHSFALADPDMAARFQREAKALARLDCAAIVRVYDFVRTETGAFLVMEYVPGRPLSDILATG